MEDRNGYLKQMRTVCENALCVCVTCMRAFKCNLTITERKEEEEKKTVL